MANAKDYARVSHLAEDLLFARLIKAAALEIEQYTDLALITQTITATTDTDPGFIIALPVGPVASGATVTVNTIGEDGTATLIASGYWLEAGRYACLNFTTDTTPTGPLRITYTASYGASDASVPVDLRHAICDDVLRMYDRRGDEDVKQGLSPASARIAARYRKVSV